MARDAPQLTRRHIPGWEIHVGSDQLIARGFTALARMGEGEPLFVIYHSSLKNAIGNPLRSATIQADHSILASNECGGPHSAFKASPNTWQRAKRNTIKRPGEIYPEISEALKKIWTFRTP